MGWTSWVSPARALRPAGVRGWISLQPGRGGNRRDGRKGMRRGQVVEKDALGIKQYARSNTCACM